MKPDQFSPSPRMHPKKSYYFVFTPLGYMNALEYQLERNPCGSNYLFVIPSTDGSARQIASLMTANTWTQVTFLWPGQVKRWTEKFAFALKLVKTSVWLRWLLARMAHDDDVIVSHLDNPYARLISQYRRERSAPVVLVDDGLFTIACYAELTNQGVLAASSPGLGARANLERVFLSAAPIDAGTITFYSIFSLETIRGRFSPRSIQKNRLSALRRSIKPQQTGEYVLFIGQPWLRSRRAGESEYYSAIDLIAEHYRARGLEFIYVPHRNENREDVRTRYRTIESDAPLEIFLVESESLPRVLAGFYSTAILMGFHLFGSRMAYEMFWGFPTFAPASWDPGGVTDYMACEASRSPCISINRDLGSEKSPGGHKVRNIEEPAITASLAATFPETDRESHAPTL